MKLHGNARLSVKGRELLVDRVENAGWSLTQAAEAAGVSDRTARKWRARYRLDGPGGLMDHSSAPTVVANRTDERRLEVIAALRRLRMTGAEIAECLGMAVSTVSGILTRIGMGKLSRLGLEPAERYERARPGELLHIDVKKLGRIHQGAGHRFTGKPGQRRAAGSRIDAHGHRRNLAGWEYVHIAIDDATRLAYVEVLTDKEGDHGGRLPSPRRPTLRSPWDHDRATHHRQRLCVPVHDPRDLVPHAGDPPPPHPALPATDQRQGRALHPNPPRRLGLRRHLPIKRSTQRSPHRLA
jgi:transposase